MMRKGILSIRGVKLLKLIKTLDISLVQQMIHHDAQTQGRQEYDWNLILSLLLLKRFILLVQKPRLKYSKNKKGLGLKKLKDYKNNLMKKRGKGLLVFIKKQVLSNLKNGKIEADEELAHRLQAQEREGYSKANKAKLLVELINERKRQITQQRAQQRRNRPLTQAQQRSYMCNYIKHMGSHTLQQLRGYSFDEIKVLFEAIVKRVNTFTPMESDDKVPKFVTGSSKRSAEEELGEETSKRQKIGEGLEPAEESKDKESDELSQEQLQ
ncbi:hypothetical protein Tco_1416366 [Tanacetum coccineum]